MAKGTVTEPSTPRLCPPEMVEGSTRNGYTPAQHRLERTDYRPRSSRRTPRISRRVAHRNGTTRRYHVKIAVPEHDSDTGDVDPPYLMLYGYAPFSPAHRPTVREAVLEDLDDDLDEDEREVVINDEAEELLWDYAGEHTEDFLRELSPFLTEPFVVQTVGYEKCRFPHVGYQYRVDPDGEIEHIQLG